MEARLENRPRQTEKALVAERVARQTDEVAQQTVETWPAGVDAEAFGRLPMFRGDIALRAKGSSLSRHQHQQCCSDVTTRKGLAVVAVRTAACTTAT